MIKMRSGNRKKNKISTVCTDVCAYMDSVLLTITETPEANQAFGRFAQAWRGQSKLFIFLTKLNNNQFNKKNVTQRNNHIY